MALSFPWERRRLETPEVSTATAGIFPGVAVQHLEPVPACGNADTKIDVWNRGEIANCQQQIGSRVIAAQPANSGLFRIMAVAPLKTRRGHVGFIKSRFPGVGCVEIADPFGDARMLGLLEEMPIQARIVIPRAPLAEFISHE